MKNFRNVLIISLAWIILRYVISFNIPVESLTDYTRFMVMFGPIAPLLVAIYGHIKSKGKNFGFPDVFKASAKAGFMYSLLYLVGILVLFQFVNPSDFSSRKALIVAQQIEANTAANLSSPEETRAKINEIFTPFNYATISFMISVLLTLFYSAFIAFLAAMFKRRGQFIS